VPWPSRKLFKRPSVTAACAVSCQLVVSTVLLLAWNASRPSVRHRSHNWSLHHRPIPACMCSIIGGKYAGVAKPQHRSGWPAAWTGMDLLTIHSVTGSDRISQPIGRAWYQRSNRLRRSFTPSTTVVQVVAFAEPHWLPEYVSMMQQAGFEESPLQTTWTPTTAGCGARSQTGNGTLANAELFTRVVRSSYSTGYGQAVNPHRFRWPRLPSNSPLLVPDQDCQEN